MNRWRIGSRGSRLALWQAEQVLGWLQEQGEAAEIVVIKTRGEAFPQMLPQQADGKGFFIKELEEALLDGRIDLAVHSLKDVPTDTQPQFCFPALLAREDPRDCLLSAGGYTLDQLPHRARVGTSSVRRQAQLRHLRPDLEILPLRGNVDTRVAKLDRGEFDAIVVAGAGIKRLGLEHRISQWLPVEWMLPAVAQGVIAVETSVTQRALNELLRRLDDSATRCAVTAERALLAALGGGCQVPVGALAHLESDRLILQAVVASPDGHHVLRLAEHGTASDPVGVGRRLAERLLQAGADWLLALTQRNASTGR